MDPVLVLVLFFPIACLVWMAVMGTVMLVRGRPPMGWWCGYSRSAAWDGRAEERLLGQPPRDDRRSDGASDPASDPVGQETAQ